MDKSSELHIIDASSLLQLKAELYKKQELVKHAKKSFSNESVKRKPLKCKGDEVIIKKAKNEPKNSNSIIDPNAEEDELIRKSRSALEAKAKLYEKIVVDKVDLGEDDSENYLVDFQRKILYDPTPVKKNDTSTPNNTEARASTETFHVPKEVPKTTLHQDTLTPTSAANDEGPLHYQDVQFNEVRDHGIGYYAFSTDKEKRKEQMDLLKTLRQQTEKSRSSFEETQQKKKSVIQSRLAKICSRRNISKDVIGEYVKEDDVRQDAVEQTSEIFETTNDVNVLNDIPLPEEIIIPEHPKAEKMRPWDIGKDFRTRITTPNPLKVTKKFSQKNWVESKRDERNEDFAPPSTY